MEDSDWDLLSRQWIETVIEYTQLLWDIGYISGSASKEEFDRYMNRGRII